MEVLKCRFIKQKQGLSRIQPDFMIYIGKVVTDWHKGRCTVGYLSLHRQDEGMPLHPREDLDSKVLAAI